MASVKVMWTANAAAELVAGYNIYQDAAKVNTDLITVLEFMVPNVAAGEHNYTVSAVNTFGEGPQSDPVKVSIPSGIPSKVVGVTVSISMT